MRGVLSDRTNITRRNSERITMVNVSKTITKEEKTGRIGDKRNGYEKRRMRRGVSGRGGRMAYADISVEVRQICGSGGKCCGGSGG